MMQLASSSASGGVKCVSRIIAISNSCGDYHYHSVQHPTSELWQAMKKQLDTWLIECARNLNDGKLLAMLSGGDVVAQELKYHYSCLTALYNKERAYLLTIDNQDDSELSQERKVYLLVFSELLNI
jgi:hypothetical protein